MESRRVSAVQCGGQQSQVMVDGAVVRRTAPNNRVCPGVRLQPRIDPFALRIGPDRGAHERRHGQQLQIVFALDVLNREPAHARARRLQFVVGDQRPGTEQREHWPQRIGVRQNGLDRRQARPERG